MSEHAAFDSMSRMVSALQMALQVAYELAEHGPGNAAQLAERMTERDPDGHVYSEEHVDAGLAQLDQYALLDYPSLDEHAPVVLHGASG